ncbi:MAG: tRNA (N(6)-L-threonylcarbamoyladenosine(37)-C(2))-methylthiotransferase MtaB [Gemmatimonadetes bacterium]|jgi:threonylcarbamoyladenosine tRNA methylthiotransferase MtaB|nr:tRNA (N(6)-L-threonylcarbamoyladenosine(37)-C(2))-methylthiotransferase MtaB [Gemmatimonadota bacterium]MBT6145977.1 tRNA (N(6)-L-threonylcarbamoyladenosine(37)-C(2))-methylthiotransferase MtaB [Gemmatimonadota bacterium]MBT7860082.1 tRNA (N(6)-L-threonylcarbamoyladenosine(37)-C(2))-methylthiotransferase MtaB [Gemmatimonadota bacterium]
MSTPDSTETRPDMASGSPDELPGVAAPRRVAIQNVGCKLNLYESEALNAGFRKAGFDVVGFDDAADIYVVNTCTVTGAGDADSRRAVRQARRHSEDVLVVATGCYAQRRPEELTEAGASLIVANGDKAQLVDAVTRRLADEPAPDLSPRGRPQTREFLEIDGLVEGGRTRGTLQIQDGCDEHCTYCIIPQVRGVSVSRPVQEVLAQAHRMVDAGYVELALTGVHTGSFGHDLQQGNTLVELLVALEQIDGLHRIRLNSVEPNFVTDELIDWAATSTRLCRHYHIPLQSGDDDVLRRMGRRYDRDHYADRIQRLSAAAPDACIGADVMVGFPGETDAQFENSLELLTRLPMSYLHVFSYSLREGTPAQRLPDHAPRQVKSTRARRLIEWSQQQRLQFHRRHVGQQVELLIEKARRGDGTALAVGTTDNYIRVLVEDGGDVSDPQLRPHELVDVQIDEAREDLAFGSLRVPQEVAA